MLLMLKRKDGLSSELKEFKTRCLLGNQRIFSHLMYADDLVIMSPCRAALQQLLRVCTRYGARMCDKFNPRERERVIMMARTEEDQKLKSPAFYLSELDLGQSYKLYAKAQYAHTQISYLH